MKRKTPEILKKEQIRINNCAGQRST